ncbi:aldo/keto reductase [Ochrovirga pacifica]|uniref:aldo/keto reductase n=1 Tax=Ochrovirga pacifica TaxID=1042376 RepID=UPI0002557FD8|nr:aldo/keto reductase [Ochrovirga pacifica]
MTKIGLGLAALGRPEYINIRDENSVDKSIQAFKENAMCMLNTAYDLGIRYFDTAPSYGKGEAFLQEWQNQHQYTDTLLATKWGYTYVANWKIGYKGPHEIKEHSIDKLLEQWQVSKNLLPALKVYQIHSATLESGVLENQKVLKKLALLKKETGLLIGITSSGPHQDLILKEAAEIKIGGVYLFDVFQVTYNVLSQNTFDVLKQLIQENKKVVIKECLANGRVFQNPSELICKLARKYNVGIDAIAFRFVIDSLNPAIVLSGAFSEKQLKENLKALDFSLTEEEINALKSLTLTPKEYWSKRKTLAWN